MRWLLMIAALGLSSCARVPTGIQPVAEVAVESYLGSWYEIARLDNKFEKGLSHVTADYSLNPEGSITVRNMGFSSITQKWEEAVGRAEFVDSPPSGRLRVSFQWPFYSSYIIFKLDPTYSVAYVAGGSKQYLWLLSRSPQIDPAVLADFKASAAGHGFDLSRLIIVNQEPLD